MIKISIFGVGLMGGSLALNFKGKAGYHIVGYSPRQSSAERYLEQGVVDEATTSLEDAAVDADFIFLCVPVGTMEEYLLKLHQLPLKPGCIITDVGSTKHSICEYAASLKWEDAYFIGGHPMAGSERSGVEAAHRHLYENAFYVLTPLPDTPQLIYERLARLIEETRAHIIRIDPEIHDQIVGAVSHLPHIIAIALVNQVANYNEKDKLYERLAAGGFRDLTRIASCDPVIWRDILLHNREVLLSLIRDWNQEMDRFAQLLELGDGDAIEQRFALANEFRRSLPERRRGLPFSAFDLYVDVPDHPGTIGEIASQLGMAGINLKNIQVMESRDHVPGVLRLTFGNEIELNEAVKLLEAHEFIVHVYN